MPETVSELVNILEERFPRLKSYLVHENGTLRQHVQIYLDEAFIRDRAGLSDPLAGVTSVHVMQALSGG